jgi:hypothetical protein
VPDTCNGIPLRQYTKATQRIPGSMTEQWAVPDGFDVAVGPRLHGDRETAYNGAGGDGWLHLARYP